MGKGGGCFPSKSKTKKPDDGAPPAEPSAPEPAAAATSAEPTAAPAAADAAAAAAEPAASTAEAAGAAGTEAPKAEAEAPPEGTTTAAKPDEPAAAEGSAPAAPVTEEAAPVEATPAAAEPAAAEAAPADAAAAAAATEAAAPSSETPATGSGDVSSAVAAADAVAPGETPPAESGPSAVPVPEAAVVPVPGPTAVPVPEAAEPVPEPSFSEPPSAPEAVAEAAAAPAAVETVEAGEEKAAQAEVVPPPSDTVKVYIVFYSMYGHVLSMAHKVKEGVDSVDGAQGFLFQVPETLPDAVLAKMGAPAKPLDIPEITPKALFEADAIIFGFPTRFGMMCAQMKQFLDATGSLWRSQALSGKPAGFFFSTGTQGGGQETTALTAISQLAHHGMMYVPVGYTYQGLFNPEVHGGSPYGAGTYVADGSRNPSELELEMAAHQGRLTAIVGAKLKKGSLAEDAEEGG